MSTPSTWAPSFAAGSAVVPSPHPRSKTSRPLVIASSLTNASPLSLMHAAIRVKSPFSQSALFGFTDSPPVRFRLAHHRSHGVPALSRTSEDERAVLRVNGWAQSVLDHDQQASA